MDATDDHPEKQILEENSSARSHPYGLTELFATLERLTGLEISIYPPAAKEDTSAIRHLPLTYRRHMSAFCRAVKHNRSGRGCGGHDSSITNRRAAEAAGPFVQVCHAGVAEVIVPLRVDDEHLATVFLGQAVTEAVEQCGFEGLWQNLRGRGVDRSKLRSGFDALPRMAHARLLELGHLLDAALRGLMERMSVEAFRQDVALHNAPAVRRAIDILRQERCWDLGQAGMASRVHMSPAHFSRLFHQVVGETYTDYVTGRRMALAQTLLHHTDLPVGRIALRCGFARQSYFARRFRKWTGMTPRAYRTNRPAEERKR